MASLAPTAPGKDRLATIPHLNRLGNRLWPPQRASRRRGAGRPPTRDPATSRPPSPRAIDGFAAVCQCAPVRGRPRPGKRNGHLNCHTRKRMTESQHGCMRRSHCDSDSQILNAFHGKFKSQSQALRSRCLRRRADRKAAGGIRKVSEAHILTRNSQTFTVHCTKV